MREFWGERVLGIGIRCSVHKDQLKDLRSTPEIPETHALTPSISSQNLNSRNSKNPAQPWEDCGMIAIRMGSSRRFTNMTDMQKFFGALVKSMF
jgi:hypothetical protein